MEIRMRAVPIAAALWAAHALAQSPTPAAPAPAPATATAPAPASAPVNPSPPANSTAPAETAAAAPAATAAPPPSSSAADEPLHWGLDLALGVPDGVGAAAVFRPMTWLRLNAGATWNVVSFGVRGGVSVVPFYYLFSPSLNLEVGHFFSGDITPILQQAFPPGSPYTVPDSRLLKEVAYDYVNGSLGLEFGIPKTFAIYLRGGLSYIQTTLRGFQELVQEAAGGDPNITALDLNIRLVAPGLKLGVIVYF
jgi:hypothetical protein